MSESTATLDDLDARLLDRMQRTLPLVSRPFAAIARELGVDERQVLERVRELRHGRKVIRQISAIFDTAALGYASSLVAAKVEPERLEAAAAVIGAHPGVSHNYERSHAFNLWYTIAVPPDSALGLEATVDRLHELSGAAATRLLPTLKLYKIGVRFNMAGGDGSEADGGEARDASPRNGVFTAGDRDEAMKHAITPADKPIIRAAQQDLPLVPEPFATLADEAGVTVDQLLAALQRYEQRKQMRRFAAVLRHHAAGYSANLMAVWRVPDDRADAIASVMVQRPEISHCYLRPSYPDWPFNIYTMIHARTREAALDVVRELKQTPGIEQSDVLWSVREFKKVRVKYFTGDTEAWEAQYAQP